MKRHSYSPDGPVKVRYTNHRGETAIREVQINGIFYGHTDWHPQWQWFLKVFDFEKNEFRDFALMDCDFLSCEGVGPIAPSTITTESLSFISGEPSDMTDEESEAYSGLRSAISLAHGTAVDAGWYQDPATGERIERNFGEVVALMHSELSEALEAHRKNLNDDKIEGYSGVEVELADCIIRILDTAGAMGLDVAGALIRKNRYNRTRADHKLENRGKEGGKRY